MASIKSICIGRGAVYMTGYQACWCGKQTELSVDYQYSSIEQALLSDGDNTICEECVKLLTLELKARVSN